MGRNAQRRNRRKQVCVEDCAAPVAGVLKVKSPSERLRQPEPWEGRIREAKYDADSRGAASNKRECRSRNGTAAPPATSIQRCRKNGRTDGASRERMSFIKSRICCSFSLPGTCKRSDGGVSTTTTTTTNSTPIAAAPSLPAVLSPHLQGVVMCRIMQRRTALLCICSACEHALAQR